MGEPDPLVSGQLAAGRTWCLRRLGMDREWLLLEAGSEVRASGPAGCGSREAEERRHADPACGEAPKRQRGLAGPGREARRGRGLRPGLEGGCAGARHELSRRNGHGPPGEGKGGAVPSGSPRALR